MQPNNIVPRSALIAAAITVALSTACASAPRSSAAQASLNDPRMVCAKAELTKLGYDPDASVRRPGRIIATRTFPIVRVHRTAIMAEVDSVDKSFDVWARVLPRDGNITIDEVRQQPPVNMLLDAMQVENLCYDVKR